jgi:ABC-type phosphate transport system substrate-binding protein
VLVGLLLATGREAPAATERSFKVIVNPGVTGKKVSRDVLAQIYLGNVQKWGDGKVITAVDLSTTSRVRQAFSADVLEMPIIQVQHYWVRSMSTGKRPPRTKDSDEQVIAFVAGEPGGVGYVSLDAPVPPSVRIVEVE